MKKLISLVLAIAMLVSLVPTFAFATETETQTSNIITLFDFGDPATFGTATYSKKPSSPSALAYEGKDSSLRWEMQMTSSAEGWITSPELDMTYSATDLSTLPEDSVVNVRFYSDAVGSKFNLVYFDSEGIGWRDTDGDGVKESLVSYNEAITINGGWQVHSMPLSTLLNRFLKYDEDNKLTIRFNDNDWNNLENEGYNDGDTVYIDQIWVDTNPEAYYDALDADENNKVVWNYSDGVAVGSYSTGSAVDMDKNTFAKFSGTNFTATLKRDKAADSDGSPVYNSIFDTTGYNYLNLWLYSPQAQDDGINVVMYTVSQHNSGYNWIDGEKVAATANASNRFSIPQVDWEGWKLVSLDISSIDKKVIYLDVNAGGWTGQTYTNRPDYKAVEFGVDGIWLSKGETSPASEWETENSVGNVPKINPKSTDKFTFDFNNGDALIGYATQTGNTKSYNSAVNRYNNRVYDVNARLSFRSAEFTDLTALSGNDKFISSINKSAVLQVKERTTTDFVKVESGDYLNAWIYNPEPKYTFDGVTPADIVIGVSSYTTTHSYAYFGVQANWSGWKLISLPLSTLGYSEEKNISHIFIACNYGRISLDTSKKDYTVTDRSGNVTTGTATYGLPKIYTGRNTLGYGRVTGTTGSNVFARPYTLTKSGNTITGVTETTDSLGSTYNYIDVERVWISSGPVTDDIALTYAGGPELRCSSDGNNVSLFTAEADTISSSSVNVIKTIDGVTSKATATYANGALTFDNFEYGATYYVNAEIIGTNGVKKHVDFTFTNEDIHVSDVSNVGGTVTITMHGNLGQYATANIIAAVYTSNSFNELEKAYVGNTSNGVATVTIPADTNLDNVQYFLFDNMDNIKPLKFNIQK